MRLFDLVFLACALALLATLSSAAWAAIRGRTQVARRRAIAAASGVAVYMVVVLAAGALTPQRILDVGQDYCADDWCIAVVGTAHPSTTPERFDVTFRVSSRARRVVQREHFIVAYVVDQASHRHDAVAADGQPPFDVQLQPQQAVQTVRSFTLPAGAMPVGVVITREGGFDFPGCCIIGDDDSLLHKRTMVRVPPA